MADGLLLGVDVGTSAVKVVLCDSEGVVVGRATSSYNAVHSSRGRSEMDPREWWRAMQIAIPKAAADAGRDAISISALALSTQGGTLVPLDAAALPTTPAILWTDTRCEDEGRLVADEIGRENVYETTGWPLGHNLNLLQTLWLRRNEPKIFHETHRFLSVADYLMLRLTGIPAVDVSNGGVNQFADFRRQVWDPRLLAIAGLTPEALGDLVSAGEVVGQLLPSAAAALGLSTRVLVVNGGHDQYCAALGIGAIEPGDTFIGSGTAWVLASVTGAPEVALAKGHCVSRHVVPEQFGSLISLESGGASLEWWRRTLARGGSLPSWDEFDANLPSHPDDIPLFMPFLYGTLHPIVDHSIRGGLMGIEAGHGAYDIATAIMAGVVFQTVWALERFPSVDRRTLLITGGAVKSRAWTQILADVSMLQVEALVEPDTAALGAALLAGRGSKLIDASANSSPSKSSIVEPGTLSDQWQQRFDEYKDLVLKNLNEGV